MENSLATVLADFKEVLQNGIKQHQFVKLTLSKNQQPSAELQNVYVRLVHIKSELQLSLTYRYATNDQVKNFSIEEGITHILTLLNDTFLSATLFTTAADYSFLVSKKGKVNLSRQKATFKEGLSEEHDRTKKQRALDNDAYLHHLGITDEKGTVIPKMSDKFRQINKYLEIIESLLKEVVLPERINIVDMGSGKGYLTFALYDYLRNKLQLNTHVTGIELREELVEECNGLAQRCGFDQLKFVNKRIEEFVGERIDILIALHACDTATDDAIYQGLKSAASVIVCAPCCHKQIRQQLKGKTQHSPLLKYGIFKERQFEMVTDTIRALIMEEHQYSTKIFEFISNEHTRKNVMLVGLKHHKPTDVEALQQQIDSLKKEYGIDYHYLEKLEEIERKKK